VSAVDILRDMGADIAAQSGGTAVTDTSGASREMIRGTNRAHEFSRFQVHAQEIVEAVDHYLASVGFHDDPSEQASP
jgi:hypothetical protein